MTEPGGRVHCAFQLLRYVPDPVRNEFVTIGTIVREEGSGAVEVRFTRDWRRVRCIDPDVNTEVLEALEGELRERLQADREGKLKRILDESMSLGVQLTEPKAYLAESLESGLSELMRIYVDAPPRLRRPAQLQGRAAIRATLRQTFENAQVWQLMWKQIPASRYTHAGDPLHLDAGYRPNGIIRIFHAVHLDTSLESAKVLASSSASLHAGVRRVDQADLELTAIVQPFSEAGATEAQPELPEAYRFGVSVLEEHRIRVLTTADLPRLAATARRELRVE